MLALIVNNSSSKIACSAVKTPSGTYTVLYRGVVLTKGLCIIHFRDHQYSLCMYAHDSTRKVIEKT